MNTSSDTRDEAFPISAAMTQTADSVTLAARFFSIAGHPFLALPAAVYVTSLMNGDEPGSGLRLLVLFGVVALVIAFGVRAGPFNNFDVCGCCYVRCVGSG